MILTYKETEIQQRDQDNFVNLTQMAKANGVRVIDWTETKSAKEYLEALQQSISAENGTNDKLIIVMGFGVEKATWGHPLVAIAFAQWISPEFHVWCNKHIKTLLETGKTELKHNEVIPLVDAKVEKDKDDPLTIVATVIDLKQKLDGLKQDRLTELLNYQLTSQIEMLNVNQKRLGTAIVTEQKHYQPCNLRAKDLGYNIYQVSNGTDLGRYVKKLVEPAFKDYQGQYHVWHYEVNKHLDNAIHSYFKKDINR